LFFKKELEEGEEKKEEKKIVNEKENIIFYDFNNSAIFTIIP
jgi:hypothetical protein